jgi:hypothetical protein
LERESKQKTACRILKGIAKGNILSFFYDCRLYTSAYEGLTRKALEKIGQQGRIGSKIADLATKVSMLSYDLYHP